MEATAGAVRTAFIADDSQYSPTLRKMMRQSTELGNAQTVLGQKIAQAGHAGVAPWMASSAALRVLEGNVTNNIRAAERFVASSKTMQNVLLKAFPVIGGIALLGVFSQLIEKTAKYIEKADGAARATRIAWNSLNVSADAANDKLSVTNDKLDEQIAKLEGTPTNNLKTMLDEARVSADALAEALGHSARNMASLMKDNHISGLSGFFSGQATTGTAEGSINSFNQQITDLGYKYQEQMQSGDTRGAAATQKQLQDKYAAAISWSDQQLKIGARRQTLNKYTLGATGDYSGAISDVSGFRHEIISERSNEAAHKQHDAKVQRLKQDQQHLATIRTDHDNWESTGIRSHAQEAAYWKKVMAGEKPGSEAFNEAQKSYSTARNSANRDSVSASTKSTRTLDRNSSAFSESARRPSDLMDLWARQQDRLKRQREARLALTGQSSADVSQYLAQSRITQRWNALPQTDLATQRTEGYDAQRQAINDSHEATSLQIARQQQTGQMTAHQAALASATNDTKAYNAQCKLLTDTLADINKIVGNTLTQAQRDAQSKPYRAALLKLPGSHAAQMAKDANALQDTTLAGGISNGAADFFRQYSPDQIAANITGNTLSSINGSITSGITTGKFHGASMVRGIAGNIGNQALGGLESKFLGPMFAKLGTKGNPMYVKSADGVAGAAASGLKSLFSGSSSGSSSSKSGISKLFSGISSLFSSSGSSSSGSSSGGGFFGKLMSTVATAVPFLAGGGDLSSGMAAIVGENGPELFKPKNAGTVIPNHKIASAMGGGSGAINVDARGAMDPAATATAVQRAVRAGYNASMKNSSKAQHEMKMRSPARA